MNRNKFNNTNYLIKHNYSPLNIPYYLKIFNMVKQIYGGDKSKNKIVKFLEIGCHDGKFAYILKKELGFDSYGVDISRPLVKIASKKIKSKVADVEKRIPFHNDSFDLIIATELIEHLYDTDVFLDEVYRVLKKNGFFILCTPNLAEFRNRIKLLVGKGLCECSLTNAAGHIRYYTKKDLIKQLNQHGFSIIRAVAPNITSPILKLKNETLKKFLMKLGDYYSSLGSHLIVLSGK